MQKRRTRLEMYFDVLMSIKKGNHKMSHIMNEANISWQTMKVILDSLQTLGIIEEVEELSWENRRIRTHYEFTNKGESMMRYLRDHTELLRDGELGDFYR
jgi:predicted transcriptional regulator